MEGLTDFLYVRALTGKGNTRAHASRRPTRPHDDDDDDIMTSEKNHHFSIAVSKYSSTPVDRTRLTEWENEER